MTTSTDVLAATASSPITYVYDDLGRLEAVVDPSAASNQIARFTYSAVGNLTRITRSGITTTPTIIDFHSHVAPRGAQITIYGAGFSATPSQNKVTFTGASAVDALTATTTKLTVTVPTAATAGPIKVKNTATNKTSPLSSQSWSPPSAAPTISSVTSPQGSLPGGHVAAQAGSTLTINGTGFAPVAADNLVRLNALVAPVQSVTGSTQLTVEVPPLGGSGSLSVRTANGSVTATQQIVLAEQGYQPGDFDVIRVVTSEQPTSYSLAPGDRALILVSGSRGQAIFTETVATPAPPNAYVNYELFSPMGEMAPNHNASGHAPSRLEYTGTYGMVASTSWTSQTVSITTTVNVSDTADFGTVNPNPVADFVMPRSVPGQRTRFSFAGVKDRNYCIDASSAGYYEHVGLFRPSRPDGETAAEYWQPLFGRALWYDDGGDIVFTAPETGTYIVEIAGAASTDDDHVIVRDLGSSTTCANQVTSLVQPQESSIAPPPEPSTDQPWDPTVTTAQPGGTDGVASPFEQAPLEQASAGDTALAGRVLGLDGVPIPGIEVSTGSGSIVTDELGRFLLSGLSPGRVEFTVDGRPASTEVADYGVFEIGADLVQGRTNELPYVIWMPVLDPQARVHIDRFPLASDLVITSEALPGLRVVIPRGSTITDANGKEVHDLSITPIPLDRPPFPSAPTNRFAMNFTLQPGDATVGPEGFQVIYPNNLGLAPGQDAELWYYEADEEGWETYGRAAVSEDGRRVVPERSARVHTFQGATWAALLSSLFGTSCDDELVMSCSPDPVDYATGQFDYRHVDVTEPGTPTIAIERVFKQNDSGTYSFGLGMATTYDLQIASADPSQATSMSVPGGRLVTFEPPVGGSGHPMFATGGSRSWLGAEQTGPSHIRTRDGTRYFSTAAPSSGRSAGVAIR